MSKILKPFSIVLIITLALFLIIGCQQDTTEKTKEAEEETIEETSEGAKNPTKDKPIIIDEDAGTVTIYTEVNGKYFSEPTRHGVVFKDGKNGNKSVLKAWSNQHEFNLALEDLGLQKGNNVTPESPEGTKVEGDVVKVTVTWDDADQDYVWGEVIKAEPDDKGWEIRYGGNDERENTIKTGCIICLDSCAVGITSNATWGWKSFDGQKVKFYGNEDTLPEDGTPVYVTFSEV